MVAARRILVAVKRGVQVAIIIGAGNLFRGLAGSRRGMDRSTADNMGMLATAMNALAMRDALESIGVAAEIQSAFAISGILKPFDQREAVRLLEQGKVVLFAAGTGHPYFTTDTTAALRACEIHADAVFKGTKVNGIYTADPMKDPNAKRYEKITFADALAQRLNVMDSTAFSLCQDNNLKIIVFNLAKREFGHIMDGDLSAATLSPINPSKRSTNVKIETVIADTTLWKRLLPQAQDFACPHGQSIAWRRTSWLPATGLNRG